MAIDDPREVLFVHIQIKIGENLVIRIVFDALPGIVVGQVAAVFTDLCGGIVDLRVDSLDLQLADIHMIKGAHPVFFTGLNSAVLQLDRIGTFLQDIIDDPALGLAAGCGAKADTVIVDPAQIGHIVNAIRVAVAAHRLVDAGLQGAQQVDRHRAGGVQGIVLAGHDAVVVDVPVDVVTLGVTDVEGGIAVVAVVIIGGGGRLVDQLVFLGGAVVLINIQLLENYQVIPVAIDLRRFKGDKRTELDRHLGDDGVTGFIIVGMWFTGRVDLDMEGHHFAAGALEIGRNDRRFDKHRRIAAAVIQAQIGHQRGGGVKAPAHRKQVVEPAFVHAHQGVDGRGHIPALDRLSGFQLEVLPNDAVRVVGDPIPGCGLGNADGGLYGPSAGQIAVMQHLDVVGGLKLIQVKLILFPESFPFPCAVFIAVADGGSAAVAGMTGVLDEQIPALVGLLDLHVERGEVDHLDVGKVLAVCKQLLYQRTVMLQPHGKVGVDTDVLIDPVRCFDPPAGIAAAGQVARTHGGSFIGTGWGPFIGGDVLPGAVFTDLAL